MRPKRYLASFCSTLKRAGPATSSRRRGVVLRRPSLGPYGSQARDQARIAAIVEAQQCASSHGGG